MYMETGRSEGKLSSTNAVEDRDMTINSLTTGMTYVIRMYAVSAGDISSRATSYLTATVGKCTDMYNYFVRPVALHGLGFRQNIPNEG